MVYVIATYLFELNSFICYLGITNLNTWVCLYVCPTISNNFYQKFVMVSFIEVQ